MFLKNLKIAKNGDIIRNISFNKGINLIIDNTKTKDRKESGNNVGKTTVLRLIDFCLGGKGENIYKDTEFKRKSNTQIENFLKDNIIITLILKDDLSDDLSKEIKISRNFLKYSKKIQNIDDENYTNDKEFHKKLKELIFKVDFDKPSFRQIISKNIRDEKNRLINTVKVLHGSTKSEEYEALYLFWLGINFDESARKQKLIVQKKIEENLQKRLRKDSNISHINQSLLIVNKSIQGLELKKKRFNINKDYDKELDELNTVKSDLNKYSTELSRLELRKDLISESKNTLNDDIAKINVGQIEKIYKQAKQFIPDIHKSFEETLIFHNQMIKEKLKFITHELPELEQKTKYLKNKISDLLQREKKLSEKLSKTNVVKELQETASELNKQYEFKGNLEEQKRLWEETLEKMENILNELKDIDEGLKTNNDLIQERVSEFNKYFSEISYNLYGERFILSFDNTDKVYELEINNIEGNLGTGKKKVQMAAFDLAYIQFADALGIECLHFILQDQIENVHHNQISGILTKIVNEINCQYILPVLRDKLPEDIDVKQYEILSLTQNEKLFKI
ncbi:MAG: DUF2326 domain-containing protein [Candidatus Muirbacterium halophilum]|nr:DUF2326 domain-containing protein [Candidatus Muirbacterium halophilum]MCK9475871.1 DUF2326 domain-containing protein [Candidatus Muirbacterium halophilum]